MGISVTVLLVLVLLGVIAAAIAAIVHFTSKNGFRR